jgi:hypothetical protein
MSDHADRVAGNHCANGADALPHEPRVAAVEHDPQTPDTGEPRDVAVAEVHAEQVAVGSVIDLGARLLARALHVARRRIAQPAADGEPGKPGPARDLGAVEALGGELHHTLELVSWPHPSTIPDDQPGQADWHEVVAPTIAIPPG